MIEANPAPPNVFLFTIAPATGAAPEELDARLLAQSSVFCLAARPSLAPGVFSHRILLAAGGSRVWQITFEGVDIPPDDHTPSEALSDALLAEVRERVDGFGDVIASAAYVDLSLPPPGLDCGRDAEAHGGVVSFSDDEPPWEDYAEGSKKPEAGAEIAESALAQIEQVRAAVPAEPGLKPWGKGHMYAGNADKAHLAYLKSYFQARATQSSASDRRKIIAFRAFQSREGSTAAINTYDNQIVTWGTGWGGLGLMGKVVERAVASRAVRDLFGSAGLRYRGKNVYDVVDLKTKRVVTGSKPALEVIRKSLPLLYLLIKAARDPSTRDAVTEAQLVTFMEGSASIGRSDEVATQALFNLIAHLKHWAPAYVIGCLEWALPKVDGEASPARDRLLAPLIGRYFYGKARKYKWIPDWKQFQLYWKHMRDDGLDCMSDPFVMASAPPAEDPFAGETAPPKPAPTPSKPPEESATILKNKPLAGVPELEKAACGQGSIQKGAKGAAVKAIQEALIHLGFEVPGGADGVFGNGVEGAVKKFQAKSSLAADAVIGPKTLKTMDQKLGALRAAS